MKHIYLDFAATTPVDNDALKAALPYYRKIFFNPASTHILGQKANAALERARERCANAIGASPDEIYFTSGGTEAVNTAFNAAAGSDKNVIVSSAIEHDSVLACCERLKNNGREIKYAKCGAVGEKHVGLVTPEELEKHMDADVALVAVMAVNNITGAVQPIKSLAEIAHKNGALFFTDAVQAVNSVDIDVKAWNVDMLAVSGHKFYAPKGTGFLYVKRGVRIPQFIVGGEQESGFRAGTPAVPEIVAMGVAIEKATENKAEIRAYVSAVRDAFTSALRFGTFIACENQTPDIASVSFAPINGGRLAVALSLAGVNCSVGSACSAGSATPPKTLVEMGVERPDCTVRFSFGKTLTQEDAILAAQRVNKVVASLMSGGK